MTLAETTLHRRLSLCFALVAALGGCGTGVDEVGSGSEEVVCATRTTLRGVDVSSYQGAINWATVRATGVTFAFAKSSEGSSLVDSYFARNWAGMRAAGVIRGAYHYFHPGVSAQTQVNLVVSTVGRLEADDLPIVLDFETLDGLSESTAVSRAVTFLQGVANRTGRTPILYVSAGFFSRAYPELAPFPLWVAHYGVSCPRVPIGRTTWSFWQSSESGRVSGIPGGDVDIDVFNGSLSDLSSLLGDGFDAGVPSVDAGAPDTGPRDTGVVDSGSAALDAGSPDVSAGDASVSDAGAGDAGAGDAGAGDAGAGDAGVSGPPGCALSGRAYAHNTCTQTLQCYRGSWVQRWTDPKACLRGFLANGACVTDRGAVVPMNTCTSTLQCDTGVWGDRTTNPMRCR